MLKRVQHDGALLSSGTTSPSPLRGRLGGGVPTPVLTHGFAALPQPLPDGEGGK